MPPIIIAHRANLIGPDESSEKLIENNHLQIYKVLKSTPFDIEIDVWYDPNTSTFFLGHDEPIYPITQDPIAFFNNPRFWIHAKNYPALSKLIKILPPTIHIFSHDLDPVVLTSTRIPWVFPGKPVDQSSVIVMPERTPHAYTLEQLQQAFAICTDYPYKYANLTAVSIHNPNIYDEILLNL